MNVKNLLTKAKNLLGWRKKEAPLPRLEDRDALSYFEEEIGPELGDMTTSLATQFGIPVYDDISTLRLPKEYYKKVPYSFVKKHLVLPVALEEDVVVVAVADPLHLDPLDDLRMMLGAKIKAVFSPRAGILASINECYNKEDGAASELLANLSDLGKKEGEAIDAYDLLDDTHHQAPLVKLLNLIITEAIQQGASDIHFEPSEDTLRVRYRIDGVLQSRHTPAQEHQAQLLTRIKVMSKLDIAEHRRPQDGRIKLRMGQREIDFRVSTVPVVGGERIVMRILDKGNITVGLDNLGMPPIEEFRKLITLPEGIVLVTGPTGSGKTTTLYSGISDLCNDDTNIMTIEDPVEYRLKGVAQIGVQPKIHLNFATGLRHILRQDPDVIMVGEIRDRETAEIAIQASLTGHLVMSTLHTNDAPSAITRLVDMGIEPYLISSSLVGVLAQRLVRTICPHCRRRYKPSEKELESIGILSDRHTLYHGKGCKECFGSGYKGRRGIYELMPISPSIQTQIVKSPDSVSLGKLAREQGMKTLREHGAQLVQEGLTTISEVLRVTRRA